MNFLQNYIDEAHTKIDNYSSTRETSGSLTKTFVTNEISDIPLNKDVENLVVSVQKEVPAVTENSSNWDLSVINGFEYEDTSYDTTLTPSGTTGTITLTLGTGSFAAADVGKTIKGNGGACILTAIDGSAITSVNFLDTTAISSSDWTMTSIPDDLTYLKISNYLGSNTYNVTTSKLSSYTSSPSMKCESIAFGDNGNIIYGCERSTSKIYANQLSEPYNTDNFSSSLGVGSFAQPNGFTFNSTGTKVFVVSNYECKEYTLSTPWVITGGVTNTKTLTLSQLGVGTEGILRDIEFTPDGKKMFLGHDIGYQNQGIDVISLSVAFDINSTLTYEGVLNLYPLSSLEDITGFTFNRDGTKLFTTEHVFDGYHGVRTYTIENSWDILGNVTLVESATESVFSAELKGIEFNSLGSNVYVTSASWHQTIHRTQLTPYYSAHNATAITNVAGQIDTNFWTDINSVTVNETLNDGTINYALSDDNRTTWKVKKTGEGDRNIVRNNAGTWEYNDTAGSIGKYDLTQTVNGSTGKVYDFNKIIIGMDFSIDGLTLVCSLNNSLIESFTLNTPWDISSIASSEGTVSIGTTNSTGVKFGNNGYNLYVIDNASEEVKQFSLSSPYDIQSTVVHIYTHDFGLSSYTNALFFTDDGSTVFIGFGGRVESYPLSSNWNLSSIGPRTGYYDPAEMLSTIYAIWFNDDGTKMYVIGDSEDIFEYSLSVGYDLNSSISYTTGTFNPGISTTLAASITDNGKRFFMVNGSEILQEFDLTFFNESYTESENWTASTTNTEFSALEEAMTIDNNKMPKAQLEALTDAELTPDTTLDLAVIMETSGTSPEFSSVALNHDAQATYEGAINSVDYEAKLKDANTVEFKALKNENFKIRIL